MFPSKYSNLTCAKLKYRIKHMHIKHRFHPMIQREQNVTSWSTVALNITKNIGEATEYNNIHIRYKLLAPQSEQTRNNKCCHCIRSWMPARAVKLIKIDWRRCDLLIAKSVMWMRYYSVPDMHDSQP